MTIISNNCSGVYAYMDLGMQYTSPTIALQILPGEYAKFCKNLKHYMECELQEYTDYSDKHKHQMIELLGQMPYFPCGLLDDIVIMFQHEKSFKEAKEKWDRRKQRIDYNNLVYLFVLEKQYYIEGVEFKSLGLDNAFLFTRDFYVAHSIRYTVPSDRDYLSVHPKTGKRCFCGNFDLIGFLRGIQ